MAVPGVHALVVDQVTTTDDPGQLDLFTDNSTIDRTTIAAPATSSSKGAAAAAAQTGETNDMDLIRHIAGNAIRGTYVVVGHADRVYARADGPESPDVVRVPRYEEDAVHQLIRRGLLNLNARCEATCGAASLTGTTVTAPKRTRALIARWESLQRPTNWIAPDHRPARPQTRKDHT